MRLSLVVVLFLGVAAAARDDEDSYGDELLDKKEAMKERKEERMAKIGTRLSRVRPSDRPPRASEPTRVLKPQEEANCPIGCTCSKNKISCVNKDLDASLFLQIQPIAFPNLDTLVLTGNRFADMSGPGLFGNKNMHESLTFANLSDNRISEIAQDTFINMPHLEYLDLSNNRISVSSDNPFGGLHKLQKLYLANALKKPITGADRLSTLFDARDRQLTHLESIDLSSNKIADLTRDTFCRVPGVAELLLAKNQLSSFDVAKNCLSGLKRLDLSGNSFTTFSSSLFDLLPSLTSLDISENPIECECGMKEFIEFAQKEDSKFLNQDRTKCASPQALFGQSIFRVKLESVCVPKSSNVFSNLFLLALICTVGFFVYRFYRHRIPSPAVFQFGYSSLNERESRREEAVPEPAFL
ncbi:lron-8 [Pristionchus pacificus]|uniref:Lron-8 n=1 Tax=Pristionchus pacificus TaxID=54126 RepID=A0A2A6BUZ8_PRIPA|nr:lron-8 [Pristionchus pacificus]|eukprot:PDM69623.1 lron-8 [Pristionchus pacificus]